MVFVDTSVWIAYFRGSDQELVKSLDLLLDEDRVGLPGPVWIELISGASKTEQSILRRVLSALPRYLPSEKTWELMEEWVVAATAKGQRFAAFDLLIGALSEEHEATLWSLDKDFFRMKKLGFLKLR